MLHAADADADVPGLRVDAFRQRGEVERRLRQHQHLARELPDDHAPVGRQAVDAAVKLKQLLRPAILRLLDHQQDERLVQVDAVAQRLIRQHGLFAALALDQLRQQPALERGFGALQRFLMQQHQRGNRRAALNRERVQIARSGGRRR